MSTTPMQMSEARRYQQLRVHLSYLKLNDATKALDRVIDQARSERLSLTAALERLLETEVEATEARRLASRERFACLPEPWTLNDFDFAAQPASTRNSSATWPLCGSSTTPPRPLLPAAQPPEPGQDPGDGSERACLLTSPTPLSLPTHGPTLPRLRKRLHRRQPHQPPGLLFAGLPGSQPTAQAGPADLPVCENEFTTDVSPGRIYCSAECRAVARNSRELLEQRSCPVVGVRPWLPVGTDQRPQLSGRFVR